MPRYLPPSASFQKPIGTTGTAGCTPARPFRAAAGRHVVDRYRIMPSPALQFAAVYRQYRVAERKAGNDVGAARDRRQPYARFDLAVDEVVTFRQQRRAESTGSPAGWRARGYARPGVGFSSAARYLALVPKVVKRFRRGSNPRGYSHPDGTVSRRTALRWRQPPVPIPASSHIIQPQVVKQKIRLPARRSPCSTCSSAVAAECRRPSGQCISARRWCRTNT